MWNIDREKEFLDNIENEIKLLTLTIDSANKNHKKKYL